MARIPKFEVPKNYRMKKTALLFFALFVGLGVFAQTADDVIAKYVEAMGGIDKLRSMSSLYMEGVSVAPNGTEITSKTYKVQDKLYRQEIDFGMGSITFIVTDKEGWFSNPRNGGAFEAIPAERLKNQQQEMDCAGPLVDYSAKGHKVELIGKETIDGVEAYNIKITLKSGNVINYFIDNKNWYIIRTSTKGMPGGGMFGGGGGNRQGGGEVEVKVDYADYKKNADGYLFPMIIKRPGMGGSTMETIIEKVEVNKPVDAKLYKPE
jgi:outer membrane lipoprotein-sorting protein